MEIVESELLTRVSDVVDPASKSSSLSSKLLSWGNLALDPIPLDICGDREGGVKLVGVWFGVLGLSKLLDMSGSEFIVLLYGVTRLVSTIFERA